MTTLSIIAITLLILSVLSLFGGLKSIRRGDALKTISQVTLSLSFLAFAGMFCIGALALRGYQGFTHEQLAATVTVEPVGPSQFHANIFLANGEHKSFLISGDQLQIDAAILKWKPIASLIGLHTSYELMRVSGRYLKLQDEQTQPRTVFGLQKTEWVDMFELRRRFAQLHLLFDAEYGSASFIPANEKQQYVLLVSNSGLLFRRLSN